MDEDHGISRRHALRLVLGQGGEIARERDRHALELDQEAALAGAAAAPPGVERLGEEDADAVVDVLSEAFAGYPVIRHVLGEGRETEVPTLVRLFVMARVLRGEPLLGVREGGRLVAAAIASFPGEAPPPPEFLAFRSGIWKRLGADAERRYDDYGAATRPFPFEDPHVHLNMVGVRGTHRGRGLARRLIDAVQEISRARPGSRGVSLTTEDPANVPFYRSLGFEVVGQGRIAPGVESWGFFRRDP